MKAVLKNLRELPCRTRELTEEEKTPFEDIAFLQRYFPAIDRFGSYAQSQTYNTFSELPSAYSINQWNKKDDTLQNCWSGVRRNLSTGTLDPCNIYLKTIHLLNPLDILKGKYTTRCPTSLVPQVDSTWKDTLHKLHHRNNQAYVDAVANFVLSRFRELDLTPHCILYYGAYTGIKQMYRYNLTGDYDTYRHHRWFWRGIKTHQARLYAEPTYEEDRDDPVCVSMMEEICTCPFNESELEEKEEARENQDDIEIPIAEMESLELSDATPVDFDIIEEVHDISENNMEAEEDEEDEDEEDEDEDEDDNSSDDFLPEIEVKLDIPSVPVIVIAQEAQEGIMDELLDSDEVDGCARGTQGWEARWIAWLFQVTAALSFLQGTINFTHNDLHSNNVLWRSTKKKYLYYESRDGTRWRIPTYGKLFCLIDFGRSIFRLGTHRWISDDHWPDQDAGDQYNFGPFYDSSKPKIQPNPSFDLCRLAVSLIDGLFDEPPPKKKGKHPIVLSEEGSWIVYETKSPLYNLLWSWTIDDAGRTVYENQQGDEKYEGFDLYIRIAQEVHTAVPKEQFRRPLFQGFIYKEKIPQKETIYALKD